MAIDMHKPTKTILSLALISLIESHGLHAGGFSLYTESSAAAIGNFGAGISAEGADASTAWYNPAALILLKNQQAIVGGVGVFPSSKMTGQSTYNTTLSGIPTLHYEQSFSGLQGGENALVPSVHYALPLGSRAAFGFSIVSPFGLSTNYTQGSPVRYAATKSQFETIDISPDIAGLITDHFSIGGGIDFQYARVKFNRMIGSPAYLQRYEEAIPGSGVLPTTLDSSSNNTGDSFAIGFHTGFLFMFDDNRTRIGLNYQSEIKHQFNGSSQLTGRLADPELFIGDPLPSASNPNAQYISNSLYSNDIKLPQIITLSAYKDLNNKFALLGSVVWTGWSSFKTITLNNVAVPVTDPISTQVSNGLGSSTTLEDYRNTWRVALGSNYHITDKWMMRVGGGYDQTPTVTAHRDVRLPDSDRCALSIGTHYQMRPNLGFDLGYTYLFAANNAIVNNTQAISATSSYNVDAISKNHAQLVGLQAVWMIDQVKETTK